MITKNNLTFPKLDFSKLTPNSENPGTDTCDLTSGPLSARRHRDTTSPAKMTSEHV